MRQKLGVPSWGDPLQFGPQNFEVLNRCARWIKFSEWVDIKNKLNLTKIGLPQRELPPNGPSKIQTFQLLKLDT